MKSEFIYFADKEIEKYIPELKTKMVYPFWSNGRWTLHDLLSYILNKTGPAKVNLSTFSISEVALRSLYNEINQGNIKELNCLFDYTIQKTKLDILYFIFNFAKEIKLAKNHAKLILIENKKWNISIVGSANLSPNPRYETGVILTDPLIYNKYLKFFMATMEESKQTILWK